MVVFSSFYCCRWWFVLLIAVVVALFFDGTLLVLIEQLNQSPEWVQVCLMVRSVRSVALVMARLLPF